MDPFGPYGLSDEIVLNILAHIPDASTYLCFASLSRRLHDLCVYEENRSPFWRYYYATQWHLDPLELLYYHGEKYGISSIPFPCRFATHVHFSVSVYQCYSIYMQTYYANSSLCHFKKLPETGGSVLSSEPLRTPPCAAQQKKFRLF
jgi:hypothetical protein